MVYSAHATNNDYRFDDLLQDVRELGIESATGRDVKPRLALRIAKGAADGVITLDVTKGPDGKPLPDHAYILYDAHLLADSKKSRFDHTKDGIKKGASELRTFIKLGVGEGCYSAINLLSRAETIHQELDPKLRRSAFPAFLEVARRQLADGATDAELSDDELRDACLKPDVEPKTQAAYIKAAQKALESSLLADDAKQNLAEQIAIVVRATAHILEYVEGKAKEKKQAAALAATREANAMLVH